MQSGVSSAMRSSSSDFVTTWEGLCSSSFKMAYSVRVSRDAAGRDLVRGGVQPQIGKGEGRVLRGRGAAQGDRDAGQKLPQLEGLGDIVGRAAQQQLHLTAHRGLGADHDHGDAPEPGQKLFARKAGQHEVQQNKVRPGCAHQQQRLGAGIGTGYAVALFCERLLQQVADVLVVVDDQNMFHGFLPRNLFLPPQGQLSSSSAPLHQVRAVGPEPSGTRPKV